MRILFAILVLALIALLWASISIAQHVRRARRRRRRALSEETVGAGVIGLSGLPRAVNEADLSFLEVTPYAEAVMARVPPPPPPAAFREPPPPIQPPAPPQAELTTLHNEDLEDDLDFEPLEAVQFSRTPAPPPPPPPSAAAVEIVPPPELPAMPETLAEIPRISRSAAPLVWDSPEDLDEEIDEEIASPSVGSSSVAQQPLAQEPQPPAAVPTAFSSLAAASLPKAVQPLPEIDQAHSAAQDERKDWAYFNKDLGDLTDPYQAPRSSRIKERSGGR